MNESGPLLLPPISRRQFLKQMGAVLSMTALGALGFSSGLPWLWQQADFKPTLPPGRMVSPSSEWGHRLRTGGPFPPVTGPVSQTDVVIIGGGVAGLSAGWRLSAMGVDNWQLLELETDVGGNARHGQNTVSAYPWGAHYIPLPGPDAHWVKTLFEELGVITGYNPQGLAEYNPLYLCHEPQERLWYQGQWQDGLMPKTTGIDNLQITRFTRLMADYKQATGHDGRRAFALPVALSSADEKYRQLDRLSMADWMTQQGFTAEPLRWYVDYCCLDDYGAKASVVSAWAGIHYFASRGGQAANAPEHAVLTWPEGNGWVVSKLRQRFQSHLRTHAMAWQVSALPSGGVQVNYTDTQTGQSRQVHAKAAVLAVPRPVAARLLPDTADPALLAALHYAPWMVANVTLSQPPVTLNGSPLSWDNVRYNGPSLGYVVANHQHLNRYADGPTVLTCYWPLSNESPRLARQHAQNIPHADWADHVLTELAHMHPGIRHSVTQVDVCLWGHGMICPTVGFMWGPQRQAMQHPVADRIAFAHSDMSGLSVFEEAQYQGVQAAHTVARWLTVG